MKLRLNGWQRLGVIASCIWLLATSALVLAQTSAGPGTSIQLVETVVAKTGEPAAALRANPFGDFVPITNRVMVGRTLAVAFLPIALSWLFAYLCIWVVRWVAKGFKQNAT